MVKTSYLLTLVLLVYFSICILVPTKFFFCRPGLACNHLICEPVTEVKNIPKEGEAPRENAEGDAAPEHEVVKFGESGPQGMRVDVRGLAVLAVQALSLERSKFGTAEPFQ